MPSFHNSHYEKFLATGQVKCIDDEIPFEIPQGWEWCRLGVISNIIGGYAFPSQTLKGEVGCRVIRISDITENGFDNSRLVRYSGAPISESYSIKQGDILMAMTGGTVGKSLYVTYLPEPMLLNQRVAIIRPLLINSDYLDLVIKSPNIHSIINDLKNSTNDNISMVDIWSFLIPVPPLKQQSKIVEKYNNLLPLVEKYSQAQLAAEELNSSIKGKIRKSVLQEAIQGKLVPQIAEEGTAEELLAEIQKEKQKLLKEGKLKKKDITDSVIFKGDDNRHYEKIGNTVSCIENEIPFEIPYSWQWVRLNDICEYIQRGKSPKYSDIKRFPVVAQKCNQWSGFSLKKALFIDPNTIKLYGEERFLQDEDLMWNSTGLGTLGRMAIYTSAENPYDVAVADSHVTVIRAMKNYVVSQYLYSYFASNTVQSVIEDKADGSTKQKELATTTVKSYLVPLPPYNEQRRIVQRINELFAKL